MVHIRFMEGKDCSQNHKGECTDEPGQKINFKKTDGFTNDYARSCTLLNVRAGAVIRVYDSPDGKTGDDWTEIVVRKQVQRYCIGSFE